MMSMISSNDAVLASEGDNESKEVFYDAVSGEDKTESVDGGVDSGVEKEEVNARKGSQTVALSSVTDLKPCSNSSVEGVKGGKNSKSKSREGGFHAGDLVWGKVRSHPWWPGQIFYSADASDEAKKYSKRDGYLIAYFADQTFAWNDASKIKPFRAHFLEMEKQGSADEFRRAVGLALDEVSRRVEFGLSCTCVAGYDDIKTQVVENAGVRDEVCRREGGDRFSKAESFESAKLVEYVKGLGVSPLNGVDRLEFVTARAQLLAFNRWKGFSCLPEFQFLGDLLEMGAEVSLSAGGKNGNEVKNSRDKDGENASSGKTDLSRKRKSFSEDNAVTRKKEKSLADFLAERRSPASKVKRELTKSSLSSSGKKRKAVDSIFSDDSAAKQKKTVSPLGNDNKVSEPKRTFRVGESILRVASLLSGSGPLLKSVNETSKEKAAKLKSKEKSWSGKSCGKKQSKIEDRLSPDEMVSQLSSIARDPLKEQSISKSTVSSLVEYRNSVCAEVEHDSDPTDVKHDSDPTNIAGNLEEYSLLENVDEARETTSNTPSKSSGPASEPLPTDQPDNQSDSEQHHDVKNGEDIEEENGKTDSSPTALILNFTDLDSVPSVTNLNKIFSRFGPLKESETEIMKKGSRAKVVFCKREDAETAFSSSGKYSTFGPSLVSYRLKYNMRSSPTKSSPTVKDLSDTIPAKAAPTETKCNEQEEKVTSPEGNGT